MTLNADASLHRRGIWLMLGSVILFALNALLIQGIARFTPTANAWVSLLFRSVIGLFLVYMVYGMGRGLDLKRLLKGRLVVARGIIGALSTVAFYLTVIELGAARAVIINLTYPIFGSLIAAIWLKEKITKSALIWMLIGFIGLMIFLSKQGQSFVPSFYDGLALLGALGSGWIIVIIRRLRHEEHPSTIYASLTFYGLIITAPATLKTPELPPLAWGILSIAAILATIAQLLMTRAYQFLSVSHGSSLQMLLPITTALGGCFYFGERFDAFEIFGATLTLLATWRVVASR